MFEPDKLYRADDTALEIIGPYATLAGWRHEGRGPRFMRVGRRILYRGSDLNDFLAKCCVHTADAPPPMAATRPRGTGEAPPQAAA